MLIFLEKNVSLEELFFGIFIFKFKIISCFFGKGFLKNILNLVIEVKYVDCVR